MITVPMIKWAICLHDIGKYSTPIDILPSHYEHEVRGLSHINDICDRLKIPNNYRNFSLLCCKNHMRFIKIIKMKISKKYDFVYEISNGFKDKNLLDSFLLVCKCDYFSEQYNETMANEFYEAINEIYKIFSIMYGITLKDLPEKTQEDLSKQKGEKFGKLYRDAMISYLKFNLKNS